MKRKSCIFLVIIAALLLVIGVGYSKSNPVKVVTLNAGTIEGATYKNEYLGLTMQIPDKWQVQNQASMENLQEMSKEVIAGEDKDAQAALDTAAKNNTVQLLTMSKNPIGNPEKQSLMFCSMAEKLSSLPGVKSGTDYLLNAKKLLHNSKMKITFDKEIYSETVGGVQFSVLETKSKVQNTNFTHKYYSTVIKDYVYCFVLTYTTQEELKTLEQIVSTMKFQK